LNARLEFLIAFIRRGEDAEALSYFFRVCAFCGFRIWCVTHKTFKFFGFFFYFLFVAVGNVS